MTRKFFTIIFLGSVGALSFSNPAHAADTSFGTGGILTNRACNGTVGGNCVFSTPRTYTDFAGGLGTTFTASATNENNSGASGFISATFGDGYLPILKVASTAGVTTRTGASVDAFRAFTYTGSEAINLVLTGAVHYITSGDTGVTGEQAGEGIFNANLAILPYSALGAFGTDGIDIISAGGSGFTDCGGGATGAAYVGSSGMTGEVTTTISLGTTCSGGAITLNSGDAFIVFAGLQAVSNRGGSLDASHTFSVLYDPIKTVFTRSGESVGEAFLSANVGAVPEPATWAMMLIGFGMTGARMRFRRRMPAIA